MITPEDQAILSELGTAEVQRRMAALSMYDRSTTVASLYLGNDDTMSPDTLAAWAKLASTMGKGITVSGRDIRRQKSADELASTVASYERSRRHAVERCQASTRSGDVAPYGCQHCGAGHGEKHRAEGVEPMIPFVTVPADADTTEA